MVIQFKDPGSSPSKVKCPKSGAVATGMFALDPVATAPGSDMDSR